MIGAVWGAVFGFAAQWATRGRRDFSSASGIVAGRYDVTVSQEYADPGDCSSVRATARHEDASVSSGMEAFGGLTSSWLLRNRSSLCLCVSR